jgi:hypothetical protein
MYEEADALLSRNPQLVRGQQDCAGKEVAPVPPRFCIFTEAQKPAGTSAVPVTFAL